MSQPTGYARVTPKVLESAQRPLLENTAFAAWGRGTPGLANLRKRLRRLFYQAGAKTSPDRQASIFLSWAG
jgi:hypothetical protein